MLASLSVVYYEYISSQYAIKDALCSRKYIGSLFGMLFVTVYFSVFKSIFVCVLYVSHCVALMRNK